MNDKSFSYVAQKSTFYAMTYSYLRDTARQFGYALTLHGSLQKDLDVVAIPWVEDAKPAEMLAKALCDRVGGFIAPGSVRNTDGTYTRCDEPKNKPHGRVAYTIHLGGDGGFIDLSVMPLLKK